MQQHDLYKKSNEVCIIARSTPASLSFKGLVAKHRTGNLQREEIKRCSIHRKNINSGCKKYFLTYMVSVVNFKKINNTLLVAKFRKKPAFRNTFTCIFKGFCKFDNFRILLDSTRSPILCFLVLCSIPTQYNSNTSGLTCRIPMEEIRDLC